MLPYPILLQSVQDEHRNLQMLYVKERDKNDYLRRTIEKQVSVCAMSKVLLDLLLTALLQNHELKEMKESKDKM